MRKAYFVSVGLFVLFLLLNTVRADEQARVWTSKKGTEVNAILVKDEGSSIVLRTNDGKDVKVSRSSLSKADADYLASRQLALASQPTGSSGHWPGWLGPDRNGKSRDTGLIKSWPSNGPTLLWKTSGLGEGFAGVAVVDGITYITGGVNGKLKIFAFDAEGKKKWIVDHGDSWTKNYPGARATVEVNDGKLYLLSGVGKLTCYNAKSGDEIWTRTMDEFGGSVQGWGYSEAVLIVGDTLYVSPGSKTTMTALDKKTGKTKWESGEFKGSAEYSSAIYVEHDGVPMIINGNESGLYALNPTNGKLLWSNDFCAGNVANCPTPAYSNGYVFWSNGYGKGGICLKLKASGGAVSAAEVWRTKDMITHHGGYIIHEGFIYGNHDNGWSCLELESGKVMWSEKGVGKGSLCYADGMLYTFSEKGAVMGLVEANPEKFEMKGTFTVQGTNQSWAHPVVTGGRLYVRYADNLYCYDVKAR